MTKTTPTRRRSTARAQAREHGNSLREWLSARQFRAANARRKARQATEAAPTSRGVDRVPARYADTFRPTAWVHQHQGHPRSPYVNPDRDQKAGARLRKELRS